MTQTEANCENLKIPSVQCLACTLFGRKCGIQPRISVLGNHPKHEHKRSQMKCWFPSECLKGPRHDQVASALTQTHTFSEDSQIPPYEDGFEYLGQGGFK